MQSRQSKRKFTLNVIKLLKIRGVQMDHISFGLRAERMFKREIRAKLKLRKRTYLTHYNWKKIR